MMELVRQVFLGYTRATYMREVRAIIVASRPRQWLKNFLLFVPIVFGGQLFNFPAFSAVITGFIAFCLLSSSNYIINDILDAERDRRHPYKRNRPVARRDLPEGQALAVALVLLAGGTAISYVIGISFFLSACTFVLLHWLLYFFFRTVSVVDVLAIASGYVLRTVAGEAASGIHISVWLFLAVLSFSLLLAIGKRRVELSFIQEHGRKSDDEGMSDEFRYSERLLDAYIAVFGNATFLTYAYFTFLVAPESTGIFFRGTDLALGWIGRKWMMITIPPALYSIMRYLQLVYSVKEGMLEKIITNDKPLVIAVAVWAIAILFVVYGIGR